MSNTTILVASCDEYSDLWIPFFALFRRFWRDLPFKVYLGSNYRTFNDPSVKTITVGEDTNWSHGLKRMVEKIDSEYIILILEDFFLRKPVSTSDVLKCIEALKELNGYMLRLVPRPGPDKPVAGYSFIGAIEPKSPYRVSAQGTLWEKFALLSLIRDGESIWEFELKGSERSQAAKSGYYCVRKAVLTYDHHVVERGKWFRTEAKRFGRMNIGCDFSKRQVMSAKESFIWHVSKLLSYPKGIIKWSHRQKIKQHIKGIY